MPQRIHPSPRMTPNGWPTIATFSVCPEKLSIGRNSAPAIETASERLRAQPMPMSQLYVARVIGRRFSDNSGTELSLNLRPITRATYSWDIGMGWARNRSLAVSIAGAEFLPIDNFSGHTENVAMVGQPLGVMRGLGWIRCGISNYADFSQINLAQVCAGAPKGAL